MSTLPSKNFAVTLFIACVIFLSLLNRLYDKDMTLEKSFQLNINKHVSDKDVAELKTSMVKTPIDEKCMKRPPKAIIFGVPRCGTTTLASFLNEHPQIAINHWDSYYFDVYSNRSVEWYINQMTCSYSHQVTMERTASYFHGLEAPKRMYNWNPNVKLIVTFKEPVERVISAFVGLQEEGFVRKSKLLEDYCMTNNRTEVNTKAWAVELSNYQLYMKTWLKYFKLEQILIINGTNFISDPSQEMGKVEKFLGVENYFTPDRFAFNETKRKYCVIREETPICMDERRGRQHPNLDPNVRLLLQKYYKPLNEQLFEMIKRRFEWGY
ncbi:hypothetical protein ACF0H5_020771 [Mactra antiquata]